MTLARQMNQVLPGRRIAAAHWGDCASLIRQGFVNLHTCPLEGLTITGATSRGKWIILSLEPALCLLTALETSGKIRYHPAEDLPSGPQNLRLDLDDGGCLAFRIVGWGFLQGAAPERLAEHYYLGAQGPSPLDLTAAALAQILGECPRKPVKQLLLDQSRVAGIGNGYFQEILWRARIHPTRRAGDLSAAQIQALHTAMTETLAEAVRLGGADVDLFGAQGGFAKRLGAHALGRPCPQCGPGRIDRIGLLGSRTYYCATCQT